MTSFLVKESTLEIQATYSGLAFDLLKPIGNGLHENVVARLAEFCVLTANDIRINNDVAPLANANATYTLNALDGVAQISFDRLQIAFFSPHHISAEQASGASLALIEALQESLPAVTIKSYVVTTAMHCVVKDVEPTEFTRRFLAAAPQGLGQLIGNSVKFNLGPDGPINYSTLAVEMSGRHSDSVFINVVISFDGEKIQAPEVSDLANQHYSRLLQGIGLEPE